MPRQSIVQFEYPAKKCRTATCPSLFPQLVKIFAHRTTISNVIEQVFFWILHLQQNRYHKGKTKIWLNSLGARCRYCANIFYEHQLLYFRPSFYHLRLQLGAECLWKARWAQKSLQFLIHLSKHCNWIVNKKTNSRYINLDRASAVRCFRSRQKPTLWLRWGVEFMACGTLKLKQSKTKKKRRSVTCSTQIMQRKFQRC